MRGHRSSLPAVPGASVWNRRRRSRCHAHHPYTYCYPPLKPGSRNSGVTLDPAWSPNGSLLAYVRGPAVPQDSTPTAAVARPSPLVPLRTRPRTPHGELAGTDGASAPQWSADGRSILYVSHDSLWLLNVRSGRQREDRGSAVRRQRASRTPTTRTPTTTRCRSLPTVRLVELSSIRLSLTPWR